MTDAPVLVVNAGSSSVKYQVVTPSGAKLAVGLVEQIGEPGSQWRHLAGTDTAEGRERVPDHESAFRLIAGLLHDHGPDLPTVGLQAVGHRVVHGGSRFREPTVVTDDVLAQIDTLSALAPLHNPSAVAGIRAARSMFPDLPQVAVFDTAFFATLPAAAYTYAIPRDLAREHGLRRYGFHGTSHAFVSRAAADLLARSYESLSQIVLHLGNGCSASAIQGGIAIETSMGLTPLQGLVMGTRSGDVDPGLHGLLASTLGLSINQVEALLNRESGLKGLAGVNDFRELERIRAAGDEAAALAFDVYVHRIRCYVGAYLVTLGSLDTLVFTAGVGENSPAVRAAVVAGLETFGIAVDTVANVAPSTSPRLISPAGATTAVLVVPTDEELAIARQAARLLA